MARIISGARERRIGFLDNRALLFQRARRFE